MSKELKTIEVFKEIITILRYYESKAKRNYQTIREFDKLSQYISIISNKLIEAEELKSLKLLSYPKKNDKEYRQSVVRRLQALAVVKEKRVNVRSLMSGWKLGKYNSYKAHEKLTKPEYDLLKEVLEE